MSGREYKTESRGKIMEFLKTSADRPVSVSEIKTYMDKKKTPVNVTTIYRYLEKLEKDGHIIKYAAGEDGKASYQLARDNRNCDRHLHLRCTECGSVNHLDCAFMDAISKHIEMDHGFALQCRNSILYGMCSRCREKKSGDRTGNKTKV